MNKGFFNVKKWLENGGSIEIIEGGYSNTWTYTNSNNDSVPYINGMVDFSNYLNPDIGSVDIGGFSSNRLLDYKLSKEQLCLGGYDKVLKGYVLHHLAFENGIMELVRYDIHKQFTHYGGNYYYGK